MEPKMSISPLVSRIVFLIALVSTASHAYTRLILKGGGTFSAQLPAQTDVTLNDRSLSSGYLAGASYLIAGATSKPPLQMGLLVDVLYVDRTVLDVSGTQLHWQGLMLPAQLYFEWSPVFWSVGGYYATILNGKFRAAGNLVDPSVLAQRKTDFGVTAGLGITLGRVVIEFRASRGIPDIKTDDEVMTNLFVDALVGIWF